MINGLKMATTQVVETSVTNNSLSKDYPHPEDHAREITINTILVDACSRLPRLPNIPL